MSYRSYFFIYLHQKSLLLLEISIDFGNVIAIAGLNPLAELI